MSLLEHAKKELDLAGYPEDTDDEMNKMVRSNVLELIDTFCDQGHSDFSAPHIINLFKTLASYEVLLPLTGEDDEWQDRSDMSGYPIWQNKRCSKVFKEADGVAYNIHGKVFVEEDGASYTNRESHVSVTFPYTPKTEYVKVNEKGEPLPNQATAEAFSVLQKVLQDDPEYAWGWHCNIAMAAFDEGLEHVKANKAAATFMQRCFEIDTSKCEQYTSIVAEEGETNV